MRLAGNPCTRGGRRRIGYAVCLCSAEEQNVAGSIDRAVHDLGDRGIHAGLRTGLEIVEFGEIRNRLRSGGCARVGLRQVDIPGWLMASPMVPKSLFARTWLLPRM